MTSDDILSLILFLGAGNEEGALRLADGKDHSEGRVEVYHDGAWGTICDDTWDINDALVVCRQLHFAGVKQVLGSSAFGPGQGDILIDDLHCIGTEINLSYCKFGGWKIHDCKHSEDAGVICKNENIQNPTRKYNLDHNQNLSHQLGKLFDSGGNCDLNITVNVDNITTEKICAHRVILALNSNLRLSQPDLNSLSINVSSDCIKHANNFIRYFYTRKIEVALPSAICILRMAFDWSLTELQNEAVKIITPFIIGDSIFQSPISIYDYAVFSGDEELQEVYIRYLAWNCEALIHSPAWTNLPLDLVKAVLSRSDLVVHNETVILNGLNEWKAAQNYTSAVEDLLKLVRFPMIPVEDLNSLNDSQYHASKLQGFQFNALPRSSLLNEVTKEENIYTSRIYTSSPWSSTFIYYINKVPEEVMISNIGDQNLTSLTSDFQTPVYNSAYFTFNKIHWKARLYITEESCINENVTCLSFPAVSLRIEKNNTDIPLEVGQSIGYSNRLVIMCENRYVIHVAELNHVHTDDPVFVQNSSEQVYPCESELLSYQVVVRPLYLTDPASVVE
ncbi:galectin-3-binding protein A-like isoform X2 [Antennarius striatus]|uniref:galectin-3-binding protein A-like isoform X2 n=1 Tax=Antennarius striatus TaxID=241820 RepID=UPI0035ADF13D